MVLRKPPASIPFTAEERSQIIRLFHLQHRTIHQLSAQFGVGLVVIQDVIRLNYWLANGKRKEDRIGRSSAKVAAA